MARDRESLPVALIAAVPLFGLKVGIEFLRFQSRRKRGVSAFRTMLVDHGMPRDQAAHLSQAYHEAGSLRILLGAMRGSEGRGRAGER